MGERYDLYMVFRGDKMRIVFGEGRMRVVFNWVECAAHLRGRRVGRMCVMLKRIAYAFCLGGPGFASY